VKGDPYGLKAPRNEADLTAAARHLGIPKKQLLVLDPKNDPVNKGTPTNTTNAEWFARLWERFSYTRGVHVRRVHYQADSAGDVMLPDRSGPYLNDDPCWRVMDGAAVAARDLTLIDPLLFADRRNPESRLYVEADQIGRAEPWAEIQFADEPLHRISQARAWRLPYIPADVSVPKFDTGHVETYGYGYDHADQPFLNWLWIEKSTMDDVLGPLCQSLGACYTAGKGYTSRTRIAELLHQGKLHGKPVRVFTISDYDPGGSHMAVAAARAIEYYRDQLAPDVDIAVRHLGMAREWVERYDLPRKPIAAAKSASAQGRIDNFERRHGRGATELDALEALHPGALARELRAALEPYVDLDLADRLDQARRQAARTANDWWRHATAPIRDELKEVRGDLNTIAARYQGRLAALRDELEVELEPHRGRLGGLWSQMVELATDADDELPARPEAVAADTDESTWLYNSRRHWWDQLKRYHAEKNGGS